MKTCSLAAMLAAGTLAAMLAPPLRAQKAVLRLNHPALEFKSPEGGSTFIERVRRGGEPAFRFMVRHAHRADCRGWLYVTLRSIAYYPAATLEFQEHAFDLQRSEIIEAKTEILSRTDGETTSTVKIRLPSQVYYFEVVFESGAERKERSDRSARPVVEFFKELLEDFEGARNRFELLTASLPPPLMRELDPQTPGLTLEEVLALLDAGVTPARMETIVKHVGVAFELTNAVEAKLRALGATDSLLLAIAKAKK